MNTFRTFLQWLMLAFIVLPSVSLSNTSYDDFMASQASNFANYQQDENARFDEYKALVDLQFKAFSSDLSLLWDKPIVGSPHIWVWYSDDLKSRAFIDFEIESIAVETLNDRESLEGIVAHVLGLSRRSALQEDELAQRIQHALQKKEKQLTEQEPNEQSLLAHFFGAKAISQSVQQSQAKRLLASITIQERENKRGYRVRSASGMQLSSVGAQGDVSDTVTKDTITLDAAHKTASVSHWYKDMPSKAKVFERDVDAAAEKFRMPKDLIFAVIETESSFNPMARSPIPAYGLMQIVPRTAGMDAANKIYGEHKLFAPDYLYNASNNIELGAAYLNVLYYRYLRKITNLEVRKYLTIASYNTGTTNAVKALTGIPSVNKSAQQINQMDAETVYATLLEKLPARETRLYLEKVTARMKKYQRVEAVSL